MDEVVSRRLDRLEEISKKMSEREIVIARPPKKVRETVEVVRCSNCSNKGRYSYCNFFMMKNGFCSNNTL